MADDLNNKSAPPMDESKEKVSDEHADVELAQSPSSGKGDILGQEHTDPVLNAKMHLVNNVSRDESWTNGWF